MFKRISNLFRGFMSLFISGMEKQNPEALLEVETENLRKQIAQYNQGLISHAGLCERLMTQVKKLEGEQRDLRAKTTANLRAGNNDAAGQYALRLQTVERELTENRAQLQSAETTYKELIRARDVAVSTAKAKIETLRAGISDLKMKRAMAELTEMASGMVNQDAPHQLCGHAKEMCPALPVHRLLLHQLQISLMHQRGSLQRVVGSLVAHITSRQSPQLVVHHRDQPGAGVLVPAVQG